MAKLSKEQYSRRNENAAIRNENNKVVNTLTEDQHEVLAWLCSERHRIHSNIKSMFLAESSEYSELWDIVDSRITKKLNDVGLRNNLGWDRMDIPNDHDYNTPEDEGGYEMEDYDEAYALCYSFVEKINSDIEIFLSSIDKAHGTNYCPTGTHRML